MTGQDEKGAAWRAPGWRPIARWRMRRADRARSGRPRAPFQHRARPACAWCERGEFREIDRGLSHGNKSEEQRIARQAREAGRGRRWAVGEATARGKLLRQREVLAAIDGGHGSRGPAEGGINAPSDSTKISTRPARSRRVATGRGSRQRGRGGWRFGGHGRFVGSTATQRPGFFGRTRRSLQAKAIGAGATTLGVLDEPKSALEDQSRKVTGWVAVAIGAAIADDAEFFLRTALATQQAPSAIDGAHVRGALGGACGNAWRRASVAGQSRSLDGQARWRWPTARAARWHAASPMGRQRDELQPKDAAVGQHRDRVVFSRARRGRSPPSISSPHSLPWSSTLTGWSSGACR